MKKPKNKLFIFFKNIWKIIDRKIILPLTKIVLSISDYFNNFGKKLEGWLSKSTTLLFLSLLNI